MLTLSPITVPGYDLRWTLIVLRPGLSTVSGYRLSTLPLYSAWVFKVPGVWTQHNFVPVPTHQVWTQPNLCWAGESVSCVNSVFYSIANLCNDLLNGTFLYWFHTEGLHWPTVRGWDTANTIEVLSHSWCSWQIYCTDVTFNRGILADVIVNIFAHLHRALRTEGRVLDINWLQEVKELVEFTIWWKF